MITAHLLHPGVKILLRKEENFGKAENLGFILGHNLSALIISDFISSFYSKACSFCTILFWH